MPAPNYAITAPPGFDVIEEPTQLGFGPKGLWAASIEDDRGRSGVLLVREPRQGIVRSMVAYSQAIGPLLEWLARRC